MNRFRRFSRPFLSSKSEKFSESDKAFSSQLNKSFGLKAKNISLYKNAIVHKSASVAIYKNQSVNNERLEYLGDAILDAIVTDYLFLQFPNEDEGFLTKMRSRIVSRQSLNCLAKAIGLDDLVVTLTNNPSAQKHIFGDALEALVGAVYLDRGYGYTAKWFTKQVLNRHVDLEELQHTESDFKSRIIELAQKHRYEISFNSQEAESSKANNPLFETKLYLNDKLMGSGFATSKKEAEQNASLIALQRIDVILAPTEISKSNTSCWEN